MYRLNSENSRVNFNIFILYYSFSSLSIFFSCIILFIRYQYFYLVLFFLFVINIFILYYSFSSLSIFLSYIIRCQCFYPVLFFLFPINIFISYYSFRLLSKLALRATRSREVHHGWPCSISFSVLKSSIWSIYELVRSTTMFPPCAYIYIYIYLVA